MSRFEPWLLSHGVFACLLVCLFACLLVCLFAYLLDRNWTDAWMDA